MTLPKTILWCDCETTGLDPQSDKLLEIATISADFQTPFDLHPDVNETFKAVFSLRDWSMVPQKVIEMHKESGLLAECVALPPVHSTSLPELTLADRELCRRYMPKFNPAYLQRAKEEEEYRVPDEDKLVLAGSTVHFDLAFIRSHLPAFVECLSHRVYDVSAIKLFCYSLGMPEIPKCQPAHRAGDDILSSIEHARRCVAWLEGLDRRATQKDVAFLSEAARRSIA
jgi:oligoribonuclease (3'-5' exoribonuclease)